VQAGTPVFHSSSHPFRRAQRAAGRRDITPCSPLQHTYGSGLISREISPACVRAGMGHASISQTVDTYGSWLPIPGAVDCLAQATAPAS